MKKLITRKKVDAFWKKRTKIEDARVSTHFRDDDMHVFDLRLIKKYITPKTRLLDLGAGTCYHANRLANKVAYIKATDKFGEFLKYCNIGPNFETEAADALTYNDGKKYDVILLLGVLNYFDDEEALQIYRNCSEMLANGGTLIVKHQSGIKDDVVVDKFSEVIGDNYHALYRHKKRDEALLKKYFNVEVIDIYPKRLNPWPNTLFYAYVCTHKTE